MVLRQYIVTDVLRQVSLTIECIQYLLHVIRWHRSFFHVERKHNITSPARGIIPIEIFSHLTRFDDVVQACDTSEAKTVNSCFETEVDGYILRT